MYYHIFYINKINKIKLGKTNSSTFLNKPHNLRFHLYTCQKLCGMCVLKMIQRLRGLLKS